MYEIKQLQGDEEVNGNVNDEGPSPPSHGLKLVAVTDRSQMYEVSE